MCLVMVLMDLMMIEIGKRGGDEGEQLGRAISLLGYMLVGASVTN